VSAEKKPRIGLADKWNFVQAVMRDKHLTPSDKVLIATMVEYTDKDTGRCIIGSETLIRETGLGHSTVEERSIPRLEEQTWFAVFRQGYDTDKMRRRPNIYMFNWQKAAEERARQRAAAKERRAAKEGELRELEQKAYPHFEVSESQNEVSESQNEVSESQNEVSESQNEGASHYTFPFLFPISLSHCVCPIEKADTHKKERDRGIGKGEVYRGNNSELPTHDADGVGGEQTPETVKNDVARTDTDASNDPCLGSATSSHDNPDTILTGHDPDTIRTGHRLDNDAIPTPDAGHGGDCRRQPSYGHGGHSQSNPTTVHPPSADDGAFRAFWSLCRKQVKKPEARSAFRAAVRKGTDSDGETVTADTLVDGMRNWAAWRNAAGESVDYDPTPANWIAEEGWKDRHKPEPPRKTRSAGPQQNPTDAERAMDWFARQGLMPQRKLN
jgi:hypothetical protein